jgi:hypothetical protein
MSHIWVIAVSAASDHLINKNLCKLQWAASGQATKHSVLASVRAKTSRRPLRCRVRDKKGCEPKSVFYALAGTEQLLHVFEEEEEAVTPCTRDYVATNQTAGYRKVATD